MADILRRMAPLSRAEPGCLQYDVHRHPDDPNTFFLFERYVDEAALEAHAAALTSRSSSSRRRCRCSTRERHVADPARLT